MNQRTNNHTCVAVSITRSDVLYPQLAFLFCFYVVKSMFFSFLWDPPREKGSSSCCCSIMSSRSPFSGSREEVSELGASRSGVGDSAEAHSSSLPSSSMTMVLKSVWEFEKIEKNQGTDEKSRSWTCGWCGKTLKGWNATKVLHHVTKAKGKTDVQACTGTIPAETLALFRTYGNLKEGSASVKRKQNEAFAESVSVNQKSISVCFEGNRVRSSKSSSSCVSAGASLETDTNGGVAVSNAARLTSAIAEYIFCKGLPFSAAEGPEFQQILKISRLVSNSYCAPTRKALSNDLLKGSYDYRMSCYFRDLEVDADVYGLSLFGDGATIHGMPLMNVLASGVGEPCAVLAIVECKCAG